MKQTMQEYIAERELHGWTVTTLDADTFRKTSLHEIARLHVIIIKHSEGYSVYKDRHGGLISSLSLWTLDGQPFNSVE